MRRIRGAIGIGLTWAAAWFAAGMVLLFVVGFGAADVPFPLFFGLLGFLTGIVFSAILGAAAGRRRFDQMSMRRVSGWGALGGLVLSGILIATSDTGGAGLMLLPVFGVAGAISAGGTLALARRADHRDALESKEKRALDD